MNFHPRTLPFATSTLAALALLASGGAHASGSGTITMMGKTALVKDAYAYKHPASYDAKEIMTTLVVCDRAIDLKKIGAAPDRDKALHEWLDETKAVYWEATFYNDGTLWTTNTVYPGVYSINGGGSPHNFGDTKKDAKRIEGGYVTPDDRDQEGMEPDAIKNAGSATSDIAKLDLKFAVDVN